MKKNVTLLILLLISSVLLKAQPAVQKQLSLVQFSSGFVEPLDIQNCGDSRLFVGERTGFIYIVDATGKKLAAPYLKLKKIVDDHKGMLGFAFDPNYLSNGFLYVYFVNKETSHLQVSRFSVSSGNPNMADPATEKLILEIDSSYNSAVHNGGCIRFGPDGYLYILTGDGKYSTGNTSQNPMSLLGKMLRIDVHSGNPYSIPSDNPFVGHPNYRSEIWALGFRNAWRWSFDALTGDVWIGDVGEHLWEEVDMQPANSTGGENYGWACYEGRHANDITGCDKRSNYAFPVYEYTRDSTDPCSAVTGGFVYRGQKYPSLYGKYIFTDYCTGLIRELYYVNGAKHVVDALQGSQFSYTSFGEDYKHELYVTSYSTGSIYHVTTEPNVTQSKGAVEESLLSVAPNPSNGNFSVTYKSVKSQQVVIRVQNLMGRQFYTTSKSVSTGTNTWKMNINLPAGNYFITISDPSHKTSTQSLRIQ